MNIEEAQKMKKDLEKDILSLILAFEKESELSVSGIETTIVEGRFRERMALIKVEVSL